MLSIAWGTAIRQLAAGLGIEVDEIRDSVEQEPAPENFDVAVGRIAKGTVAALRFQIEGMVKGHPAIVVEHVTRLRAARSPRRLISGRDHRGAVVLRRYRADQQERWRALRGDPGRGRTHRERDPGGARRTCGDQHDAEPAVRDGGGHVSAFYLVAAAVISLLTILTARETAGLPLAAGVPQAVS